MKLNNDKYFTKYTGKTFQTSTLNSKILLLEKL